MENLIFFLLLFSFCLGQIGRISFLRTDLVIHLNDVLIGITVIGYFISNFFKKEKIFWPKIIKPIFGFFLIGIISLLVNIRNYNLADIGVGSLYLLRWFVYGLLPIVVFNLLINAKISQEKILNFLISGGTITAIIGLFQYLFFPDLRPLKTLDWDPHVYRVVGTFFDPGFIGAILVLNIILVINFIFMSDKKEPGTTQSFYIGGLLISYLAMVLTYSRSTYLMFLVSMLVIAVIKKSPKFFFTVVLLFFLTLLIIPKGKSYGTVISRQETSWARIENYKTSLKILLKNPIFGVGFNNFRYAQIKYGFISGEGKLESHAAAGADSSLIFVLATTGVLGLLIYFRIWTEVFKSLKFLRLLKIKKMNFLTISLLSSIFGIFSHSLFINSLFYPFIMEWLWILVGLHEFLR